MELHALLELFRQDKRVRLVADEPRTQSSSFQKHCRTFVSPMSTKLKEVLDRIKRLSPEKQVDIADLILEELDCDIRFDLSADDLEKMAEQAREEDDAGKTKDWDL